MPRSPKIHHVHIHRRGAARSVVSVHHRELPKTCREHYFTGTTALNIPSEEGTGDWRFREVFITTPYDQTGIGHFLIAGITLKDTSKLLGNKGVFDYQHVFRDAGFFSLRGPVYAADHYRALADLALYAVDAGLPLEGTVNIEDWLPRKDEIMQFKVLMDEACSQLEPEKANRISAWMNRYAQSLPTPRNKNERAFPGKKKNKDTTLHRAPQRPTREALYPWYAISLPCTFTK
ncbi:MAG: hypothetical protein IPI58_01525 [Alphaproteobacteria bacterium]|nr:MAG: hypothetical protein IPI58_01525 [Alphaproteobacteria bacterium]